MTRTGVLRTFPDTLGVSAKPGRNHGLSATRNVACYDSL